MKGDPRIIDLLNEVLTGELTAINQYFLHAKMCLNWGYEHLGKKIYDESIDEMKHADKLVERMLFLDGLPNLQKLDKIAIGQTVVEILKNDLAFESGTVPRLNKGIQLCRDVGRQRQRGASHLHPGRVGEARGLARVAARARQAGRRRALSCPANPVAWRSS